MKYIYGDPHTSWSVSDQSRGYYQLHRMTREENNTKIAKRRAISGFKLHMSE